MQAKQIGVGIKDGIVILNGEVDSLAEKLNAERAALRVEGVRAIVVELDVRLPGSNQKTDMEIARTVEQVLNWSAQRSLHDLVVVVEKGWVTLTGHVTWNYQRRLACTARAENCNQFLVLNSEVYIVQDLLPTETNREVFDLKLGHLIVTSEISLRACALSTRAGTPAMIINSSA